MKHRVLVSVGGTSQWVDIEADSVAAATATAARTGGRILRVESETARAPMLRVSFAPTVFFQEALTLLKAGLNVVEMLEALERKEPNAGFKAVLGRLLTRLREGASFSQALTHESSLFSPVLIAGVAASETTGGLVQTLERYLDYDQKINLIKRKVTASAIYPLLLMAVGGAVILFLIAYVLPKFASILDGSGREVGWATVVLLRCGELIQGHPLALVCLIGLAIAAVVWLVAYEQGRRFGLQVAARLPVLSEILTTLGLSRLYRTLALLLDSGIPLLQALDMVKGIVSPRQASELSAAALKIRSGQMLTESLAGSSLIPPIAESLLRVGERSGALAEMSDKLANFLDIDLDRKVETFSRLFEPLLMAFIGIVIGAIVVMMYAPIFDLVGSVGS